MLFGRRDERGLQCQDFSALQLSTQPSQLEIPSTNNFIPTTNMGIAFDYAPERPQHIENILNGLDRYNPETTTIFQDYVTQQCEDRTYDCYANLALLKL